MRNYLKEASTFQRHSAKKYLLIGKIKGLSEESKHITKRFYKAKTTDKRNVIMCNKYPLSQEIREHLLAYAFLRGKAYSSIEKKYTNSGMPNKHSILKIIHNLLPYLEGPRYNINIDSINTWIRGEV